MSHCGLVLNALRDGQWHSSSQLYREVGTPMILHSRISDLRAKGHDVEGRHIPGKTGAEGYEYRLVGSPSQVRLPAVAFSPVAAPAAEQLALHVAPSHYDI